MFCFARSPNRQHGIFQESNSQSSPKSSTSVRGSSSKAPPWCTCDCIFHHASPCWTIFLTSWQRAFQNSHRLHTTISKLMESSKTAHPNRTNQWCCSMSQEYTHPPGSDLPNKALGQDVSIDWHGTGVQSFIERINERNKWMTQSINEE